ncbi:MAG: dCTP deaminase, partial [Planctomycetia bacterium]
MSVLSDKEIAREVTIEPFAEGMVRPGVVSYGVSSYGYDVRVGRKYKVFTNVHSAVVDPKNFSERSFVDVEADFCIIPPNSFALAETV